MTGKLTDDEWIAAWHAAAGSPARMARATGIGIRNVFARRLSLVSKGHELDTNPAAISKDTAWAYPRKRDIKITDGTAIVYSDAHFWPGLPITVGFRALLALISVLRPVAVIANGDLSDFPKISRFARTGWQKLPGVMDELDEVKARQADIKALCGGAATLRTIGNHCVRFDTFLANHAADFEGIAGTRLADHLPDWPEAWSVRINDDCVIKHRWHGGVHAAWNNVVKGGVTIVTGDTHRLDARPFMDYRGVRWGVETGMLSVPPQELSDAGEGPFEFFEDKPAAWTQGFAVLTWHRGRLLQPELCRVDGGTAWFRATAIASDPEEA